MIIECRGNLLDDDSDVLVNTTNAAGIMGKGLALEFKKKWPEIMKPYMEDCKNGVLKGGVCKLYDIPETPVLFADITQRKWAAFCTKHAWVLPSRYEWIISGLKDLEHAMYYGWYNSVAIPALGCGNGELEWEKVYQLIRGRFASSPIVAKGLSTMKVTYVRPIWPEGYIMVNIDGHLYIRYDHNDWMVETPSGQERPIIDDATEHEIAFRAYVIQTQESAGDDNY